MANPQNVTMQQLANAYGADRQAISDILDMIAYLESGRTNVKQEISGPGSGYYQLEIGKDRGGYTRLEHVRNAPNPVVNGKEVNVTPGWIVDALKDSRKDGERSFDMTLLGKDQQDFLMASYILRYNTDLVDNVSNASGDEKRDLILDYWLDDHWAGWEEDSTKREAKKNWAKDRLTPSLYNAGYRRNKDWAGTMDMINSEFNMDRSYYGQR